MSATKPGAEIILGTSALGFQWETDDPFLFCVHHDDHYPAGNERMGPPPSQLVGRNMGSDFQPRDGWRMYHGRVVPGFPQHPHRGFETVTVVRRGLLDHSDSMGAAARYGGGDVQWLTTGKGIRHAEMFPLLNADSSNPVELFQIWLNLPRQDKMVEPYFSMFWSEDMPRREIKDPSGRVSELAVVAGRYLDTSALPPPPNSWASRSDADVAIWTLKMAPGATLTLPAAAAGTLRSLYVFMGEGVDLAGEPIANGTRVRVKADEPIPLTAGAAEVEILVLQGRPIAEPVAQYGPFVMNTQEEIRQAFADYQATGFGGWSWGKDDPVHPREQGRFARHADGKLEQPT